jgi:hypothetical protein
MTYVQPALAQANPYLRAGVAAIAVLLMTSIHHVYGAVNYDTPFRLHIVYVAVPVAIVIAALLAFARAWRSGRTGRIALWVVVAIILFFPVALIGIYEGGYNHVVKNFVYFVLGEQAARGMCPADGVCELPNSFIFEATGIAQFFIALPAAVLAWRLLRREGQGRNSEAHSAVVVLRPNAADELQ